MNINLDLADAIEATAASLTKNEISRKEQIAENALVEIDEELQVSTLLLNKSIPKSKLAELCGISLNTYKVYEEKAIEEGLMQPAVKYKGQWRYTPRHIHAMLDYLGREKWSDKYQTSIINVQNQKGGTGKSQAAVSIAYKLSLEYVARPRICIIDLDPQGSLRVFIDTTQLEGLETDFLSAVDIMLGDKEEDSQYQELIEQGMTHEDIVKSALAPTHLPNLKIIPAFPSDERFSSHAWLNGLAQGDSECLTYLKTKIIDVIRDDFDVIFIDTGPQVNPLTWNALYTANTLLIPLTPHKLDYQSTIQFYASLPQQLRNLPEGAEGIKLHKILITNNDTENDRDEHIVDLIKDEFGSLVLNNQILRSSAFEIAARNYRTVFDIQKADKLCPPLQLDKAHLSVSAVAGELKGLFKEVSK